MAYERRARLEDSSDNVLARSRDARLVIPDGAALQAAPESARPSLRFRALQLGNLVSIAVIIGSISVSIILKAPEIPASTLQAFFGASIQVDASFLIAVFVVASFLLPRIQEPARTRFMSLLSIDAALFFGGLLESVYGLFLLFSPDDARILVGAVLITWFLGFALLLDSVGKSRLVNP